MTAAIRVRPLHRLRAGGVLSLVALAASCEGSPQPLPPEFAPITIEIVAGGTAQTAGVGTAVAVAPSVRVRSARGGPVVGARVVFSVTRGGGLVSYPAQITDSAGVATVVAWIMGPTLGPQALSALVTSSTTDTRAVFSATATVGPPASVSVSPIPVVVPVGGTQAITALHYDAYGNLVGPAAGAVYTVANTGIATVSGGGTVTGIAEGATTLTVMSGALTPRTLTVAVGPQPSGAVVTSMSIGTAALGVGISSANVLYATAQSGTLRRFDLPSETAGATVTLSGPAYDVAFSPDGATAYASVPSLNVIDVIDVATNTVTRSIGVGNTPLRLRLSPDGTTLYAGCYGAQLVRVNLANDAISTLTVGTWNVLGIALDPTRPRLFTVDEAGRVAEVALTTFTVTRTSIVAGAVLQSALVSRDGARLFVGNQNGPLRALDAANLTNLSSVTAAPGAFDIALTRNGGQLYVVSTGSNSVVVLDALDYTVLRTITVSAPRRIAFDATGTIGVVTGDGGSLTFIK